MKELNNEEFLRDGLYNQYMMERNNKLLDALSTLMFASLEELNAEYDCMKSLTRIIDGRYNPPYCTIVPEICKKANNDNTKLSILRDRISKIRYLIDRIIEEGQESQIKYGCTPEFQKNFRMFSDPMILELDHCITANKINEQISAHKSEYETFIKSSESDKNDLQNKLTKMKNELNSNKVDSVLILSIFAAISLTFTGGLGLIGSSFSSIGTTPLNELLTVILVVGFIMFNTIYALLEYILRIIRRYEPKDMDTGNVLQRHPIPICINLTLIVMIAVCLITYML